MYYVTYQPKDSNDRYIKRYRYSSTRTLTSVRERFITIYGEVADVISVSATSDDSTYTNRVSRV